MNKKIAISFIICAGIGVGYFWSSSHHQSMKEQVHVTKEVQEKAALLPLSEPVRQSVDGIVNEYFNMQKALSQDSLRNTKKSSEVLKTLLLKDVKEATYSKSDIIWQREKQDLLDAVKNIHYAKEIKVARKEFLEISSGVEALVVTFGKPESMAVYKYHCPMANNNKGSSWLQNQMGTENPYFGSEMFRCGGLLKTL